MNYNLLFCRNSRHLFRHFRGLWWLHLGKTLLSVIHFPAENRDACQNDFPRSFWFLLQCISRSVGWVKKRETSLGIFLCGPPRCRGLELGRAVNFTSAGVRLVHRGRQTDKKYVNGASTEGLLLEMWVNSLFKENRYVLFLQESGAQCNIVDTNAY